MPLIGCPLDVPSAQHHRSTCGDSIVQVGEDCDDGEESVSCNDDCTFSACGDGVLNTAAGESCDDEVESASCDIDCTAPACGDGLINAAAGEECEGQKLGGMTCMSLGFDGGDLACADNCTFERTACGDVPVEPVLEVRALAIKQLEFDWSSVDGADCYEVFESLSLEEQFVSLDGVCSQLTPDLHDAGLHLKHQARYRVRAHSIVGHRNSSVRSVPDELSDAVGYFKAHNADSGDRFGHVVALSADGRTLAVGAPYEDSIAEGIEPVGSSDNSAEQAGGVYVFTRRWAGNWSKEAYLKAEAVDERDEFGFSMALSGDGHVLAVGVPLEDSDPLLGEPSDNDVTDSGAVYFYERAYENGRTTWSLRGGPLKPEWGDQSEFDKFGWSIALDDDGDTLVVGTLEHQQIGLVQGKTVIVTSGRVDVYSRSPRGPWTRVAPLSIPNEEDYHNIGYSVALSGDGDTIAVGCRREDGFVYGDDTGAVHVFRRSGDDWSDGEPLIPAEASPRDYFGTSVALSFDGRVLAVGAPEEDSEFAGIGDEQPDDNLTNSGAVYVYARDDSGAWSAPTFIKALNPGVDDRFGQSVSLSADGTILAVGAHGQSSAAIGINPELTDDEAAPDAGAAYVFIRDDTGAWSQKTYVKAPNTDAGDWFGKVVALSSDGETLAVGAPREDSRSNEIGGEQADNAFEDAGAVYLY